MFSYKTPLYMSVYAEDGCYSLVSQLGVEFYHTQEQVHSRLGQLGARRVHVSDRGVQSVVGIYLLPTAALPVNDTRPHE